MALYRPPDFAEDDIPRLHALMRTHPFATLVTVDEGQPTISHLPFLVDETRGAYGVLRGHMARANPQWQHFGNEPALAIFHGPHAYISPTWYASKPAVPTWNYAVVHAHGVPRLLVEDAALDLVREMVTAFDEDADAAWPDDAHNDRFRRGMVAHIVAFEIPITRLDGKFKMSQNRPAEDRPGIVAALSGGSHSMNEEVAKLITTD